MPPFTWYFQDDAGYYAITYHIFAIYHWLIYAITYLRYALRYLRWWFAIYCHIHYHYWFYYFRLFSPPRLMPPLFHAFFIDWLICRYHLRFHFDIALPCQITPYLFFAVSHYFIIICWYISSDIYAILIFLSITLDAFRLIYYYAISIIAIYWWILFNIDYCHEITIY